MKDEMLWWPHVEHLWQLPRVWRAEFGARRRQHAPLWECSAAWDILQAWWHGWEWVGALGGLTYCPYERRGDRWQ